MLPERFERRMQALLGEEYGAFREALEGTRHRALRVNPLKGGPRGSRERFLAQSPWDLEPVPWRRTVFAMTAGGRAGIPTMRQGYIISRSPAPWPRQSF